jgi:hypothetical protein
MLKKLRKSTLRNTISPICIVLALITPTLAQSKRLWVLRAPGEMTEYDPTTFDAKSSVKVPPEAPASPQSLSVNHAGQMLFAAPASLPLREDDLAPQKKVWFWDGHAATALNRDVDRATSTTGSNLAIAESAAVPYLSADGTHLVWFANQARRLQREGVDLSTKTTWQVWRTDLAGAGREDLTSVAMPDCSCATGSCEETCPYGETWVPDEGVDKFFLLTQFVAGQTESVSKSTSAYQESAGKWAGATLNPPLQRVLDGVDAGTILEAIPDGGCCGWENEGDDQALLRSHGKTLTIFDERDAYKNPNYDVSFYAKNGKLAPGLGWVALTIAATAQPDKPIQLADEGQANPEELQRIRKALLDLPAVEVKSVEDSPRRIAFLPHATLVGWIGEKEILIVEGRLLVAYNVASGMRRKSSIRVEDAAHVFLR